MNLSLSFALAVGFAVFSAFPSTSVAQDADSDVKLFSVTASSSVYSGYLFDNGLTFYRRPVEHTSLTLALNRRLGFIPAGFYINAWWCKGFNRGFKNGPDDEIDGTIG